MPSPQAGHESVPSYEKNKTAVQAPKPPSLLYVGRIAKGSSGDPSMWAVNRQPGYVVATGLQVELVSTKTNRVKFRGHVRGRWVLEKKMAVFWLEELNGRIAYLAIPREWASLAKIDAIRWALFKATLPDTIPTLPESFVGPVSRWRDSRSQPKINNPPPCRCPSPDRRSSNPFYHAASEFDSEEDLAAQ